MDTNWDEFCNYLDEKKCLKLYEDHGMIIYRRNGVEITIDFENPATEFAMVWICHEFGIERPEGFRSFAQPIAMFNNGDRPEQKV